MMAKKIIEFKGYTSKFLGDGRTRQRILHAEVTRAGDYWGKRKEHWWVQVKDIQADKILWACPLTEWAEVMDLFEEAAIKVTGESLKGLLDE